MNGRDFRMKPLRDTYRIEEPNGIKHIKIGLDLYQKINIHCKWGHDN